MSGFKLLDFGDLSSDQSIPSAAPEMAAPSMLLQSSQQAEPSIWDNLLFGVRAGITFGSRGQAGNILRQMWVQEQEKARLKKSADEIQSMTGMITTALSSGDPEKLAQTVSALSKMKNIEPETVTKMQQLQIKLAEQVQGDQQEKQLAAALAQFGTPEVTGVIDKLMASTPGVKLSDAMKLVQSGLLGEKPDTKHMQGIGMVRVAGTGLFAKPGEAKYEIVVPSGDQRLKIGEGERNALREAGYNPGKWVYIDEIPDAASAAMSKVLDKNGVIPASTMVDLERAGVRLNGRTKMQDISGAEWQRLNDQADQQRIKAKRDAMEINLQAHNLRLASEPIGEKTLYYLDTDTLRHPNPMLTRNEIGKMVKEGSIVAIRPQDANNIRDMGARVEQLQEMRVLAQKILAKFPGENLPTALKLAIDRGLASNVDAMLFNGWGNALALQIASDFNKGRPSDKDKSAIDGLLPTERDTVQSAVSKINSLISYFDKVSERNLGVKLSQRKKVETAETPSSDESWTRGYRR